MSGLTLQHLLNIGEYTFTDGLRQRGSAAVYKFGDFELNSIQLAKLMGGAVSPSTLLNRARAGYPVDMLLFKGKAPYRNFLSPEKMALIEGHINKVGFMNRDQFNQVTGQGDAAWAFFLDRVRESGQFDRVVFKMPRTIVFFVKKDCRKSRDAAELFALQLLRNSSDDGTDTPIGFNHPVLDKVMRECKLARFNKTGDEGWLAWYRYSGAAA